MNRSNAFQYLLALSRMAVSTALTLRVLAVLFYSMKTRPRLILNLVLDNLPPTFLTPLWGKEGRSAGSKNPEFSNISDIFDKNLIVKNGNSVKVADMFPKAVS